MIKDTIKTKSWKDKIKVWFSETYWRPDDCIEDKDPDAFYKKFNPEITSDVKIFSFAATSSPFKSEVGLDSA